MGGIVIDNLLLHWRGEKNNKQDTKSSFTATILSNAADYFCILRCHCIAVRLADDDNPITR